MDAGRTCVFCSGRHCWCDVLHDRRQSCIRDDTRMIETTSMKTVLRPGLRQELRSSQHVQNRNRRNSSAGNLKGAGLTSGQCPLRCRGTVGLRSSFFKCTDVRRSCLVVWSSGALYSLTGGRAPLHPRNRDTKVRKTSEPVDQ